MLFTPPKGAIALLKTVTKDDEEKEHLRIQSSYADKNGRKWEEELTDFLTDGSTERVPTDCLHDGGRECCHSHGSH
jgi:hypothetical protein